MGSISCLPFLCFFELGSGLGRFRHREKRVTGGEKGKKEKRKKKTATATGFKAKSRPAMGS